MCDLSLRQKRKLFKIINKAFESLGSAYVILTAIQTFIVRDDLEDCIVPTRSSVHLGSARTRGHVCVASREGGRSKAKIASREKQKETSKYVEWKRVGNKKRKGERERS